MLQAHSFLWHYLWVAPNVLLLLLAAVIWKRGLRGRFPTFIAFAVLSSVGQLAVYTADIAPSVSAEGFWRVDWASLVVEGFLKFALIAEIFGSAFGSYRSLARVGKFLIRGVGVVLVVAAALAAAYAPQGNPNWIINGAHILDQTIYLIESGLLVFIFLFSTYFRLSLNRELFGIALGLGISACVHLATWAIMANTALPTWARYDLDFVNMATYHVCVLIWYYYLLIPAKVHNQKKKDLPKPPPADPPSGPPTSEDIDVLNEEMERLLHR